MTVSCGGEGDFHMLTLLTGLNNWLINAFNGEWLRTEHAVPFEKTGIALNVR